MILIKLNLKLFAALAIFAIFSLLSYSRLEQRYVSDINVTQILFCCDDDELYDPQIATTSFLVHLRLINLWQTDVHRKIMLGPFPNAPHFISKRKNHDFFFLQ